MSVNDTLVTRHDTQDPVETQAVTGVAETHGNRTGVLLWWRAIRNHLVKSTS